MFANEASHREDARGAGQDEPAMPNGPAADTIVSGAETVRLPLLNRGLPTGTEQVVAEQRDEGPRNKPRGNEGTGHHYGQGKDELARAARQHEEREIGDDVRYGGVEDGCGQFGRSKPCGDPP